MDDPFRCDAGEPMDRPSFERLVREANDGKQEALADLQRWLDANPQLWRRVGDLVGHAESCWLGVIANGDELVRASVQREVDRLRTELQGDNPTATERMLIDQVILTHLELRYQQIQAAEMPRMTKGQVTSQVKTLESAERRFLRAVEMLETVRKLAGRGRAEARIRLFTAQTAS